MKTECYAELALQHLMAELSSRSWVIVAPHTHSGECLVSVKVKAHLRCLGTGNGAEDDTW